MAPTGVAVRPTGLGAVGRSVLSGRRTVPPVIVSIAVSVPIAVGRSAPVVRRIVLPVSAPVVRRIVLPVSVPSVVARSVPIGRRTVLPVSVPSVAHRTLPVGSRGRRNLHGRRRWTFPTTSSSRILIDQSVHVCGR